MQNQSQPGFGDPRYAVKKEGKGCFFYGCLVSLILLLIGAVIAGLLIYKAIGIFDQFVEYLDDQPRQIQVEQISQVELNDLKNKLSGFKTAVEGGQAAEITLNAQQINGLIATNPELKELKGIVYISINDDEITGEVSFPLDKFQLPFAKLQGKYLNGSVGLRVSIQPDRTLYVGITKAEVKGQSLPPEIMSQLSGVNLAEKTSAEHKPDIDKLTQMIETINISNGLITIRARANAGARSVESTETAAQPAAQ